MCRVQVQNLFTQCVNVVNCTACTRILNCFAMCTLLANFHGILQYCWTGNVKRNIFSPFNWFHKPLLPYFCLRVSLGILGFCRFRNELSRLYSFVCFANQRILVVFCIKFNAWVEVMSTRSVFLGCTIFFERDLLFCIFLCFWNHKVGGRYKIGYKSNLLFNNSGSLVFR